MVQREKNGLICSKVDNTSIHSLALPKDQFLSGLFGPCPEADMLQKQIATESMSMARIRSLPHLSDRVKHFMINGARILTKFGIINQDS